VSSRGPGQGAVLFANDGVVNVPTDAAPGTNSRIDVVYVWQREFALDGGDTEPEIGVEIGTPGSSPAVPSLAAYPGAIELGRITVPAGVTATNSGTTITQTAPFTAAAGGQIDVRNVSLLPASALAGQRARAIDTGITYQWNGAAWVNLDQGYRSGPILVLDNNQNFLKENYPGLRALDVWVLGGGGGGGGCAATAAGQAADAGGGASGTAAYGRITDIASLPTTVTTVAGVGGVGGAAGNNSGGDGAESRFSTLVRANGGAGGSGSGSIGTTGRNAGGFGSDVGTGDIVITGGDGFNGVVAGGSALRQGNGAAAPGPYGGGSRRRTGAGAGLVGSRYGGGGTGGTLDASSSAVAGGAGGRGVVVVQLLY